jgi:excisionase family DNA binding protein
METASREILNVEQAAEFLGFSAYTVREKAREGEIPGRKVGREWRFSRGALLRWLEEGQGGGPRGYVVVVAPDPESGGFTATVQGVPGVRGSGRTEDEAAHDVQAALEAARYARKYRTELP